MQTELASDDKERLSSQREKIMQHADGEFRTLEQWSIISGGSEAGTSARLRELANKFGYIKRRENRGGGLFVYSIMPPFEERHPIYPTENYTQLSLSL